MAQVLIVDDTKETVELLSMAVSQLGHEALGAFSAAAAMELLEKRRPDLILIDFMMPGTDGLEALEDIRSSPTGEGIPVLFSTASSDKILEEKVYAAGGDGLLRKPLGLKEIERAILNYVGTRPLKSLAA